MNGDSSIAGVPREPWRGVNLGGWLLLEPGPSASLFGKYQRRGGEDLACEWSMMKLLRDEDKVAELQHHRDTYITRDDFIKIKQCGLNAVRLPIGYWVVLGPLLGEPYEGPALEYVDRAVHWAEEVGLQVLLDLHGCPGGESGGAPSGHRDESWTPENWDSELSLEAVRVLAARYKDSHIVTGFGVCNEPSARIELDRLCEYYHRAVNVVREAGMPPERVTVLLPAFQRPLSEVASMWHQVTGGAEIPGVCFDLHRYHCFGRHWNTMTFAQSLRETETTTDELRRYPAAVSEWSLALGEKSRLDVLESIDEREQRKLFGAAQLAAYANASHGWFFWTWRDAAGIEWDFQQSFGEGSLESAPVKLPAFSDSDCEPDPLEEILDPYPGEPTICFGDNVFLRSFRGTYVDVEGTTVRARWADRGEWQRVRLCPAVGKEDTRRPVQHGDVVRLLAHTGKFLVVVGQALSASAQNADSTSHTEFIVHMKSVTSGLRHHGKMFLQSKDTECVVDCGDDNVQVRWNDFGPWQGFAVEKDEKQDQHPCEATRAEPPKEKSQSQSQSPSDPCEGSPRRRRRVSLDSLYSTPSPSPSSSPSLSPSLSPSASSPVWSPMPMQDVNQEDPKSRFGRSSETCSTAPSSDGSDKEEAADENTPLKRALSLKLNRESERNLLQLSKTRKVERPDDVSPMPLSGQFNGVVPFNGHSQELCFTPEPRNRGGAGMHCGEERGILESPPKVGLVGACG